jgi:hypothetical protein
MYIALYLHSSSSSLLASLLSCSRLCKLAAGDERAIGSLIERSMIACKMYVQSKETALRIMQRILVNFWRNAAHFRGLRAALKAQSGINKVATFVSAFDGES